MRKIAVVTLLMLGVVGVAAASPVIVPEIDANTASGALALLTGALLIFRTPKKK